MTKYETENFEVVLLGPDRGYFEHHEMGDECGGGLWMDSGELIDYDGVYMLPAEVLEVLERAGVNCDEIRQSLED
jgi:hypothetical protein